MIHPADTDQIIGRALQALDERPDLVDNPDLDRDRLTQAAADHHTPHPDRACPGQTGGICFAHARAQQIIIADTLTRAADAAVTRNTARAALDDAWTVCHTAGAQTSMVLAALADALDYQGGDRNALYRAVLRRCDNPVHVAEILRTTARKAVA